MLTKSWLHWEHEDCSMHRVLGLGQLHVWMVSSRQNNTQALKASFTLFPASIQSSRIVRWESLECFVTCMTSGRNHFNCMWVNNAPVRKSQKSAYAIHVRICRWLLTFEAALAILPRTHTSLPMTAVNWFHFPCWKSKSFCSRCAEVMLSRWHYRSILSSTNCYYGCCDIIFLTFPLSSMDMERKREN